jgi:hypothetical protein
MNMELRKMMGEATEHPGIGSNQIRTQSLHFITPFRTTNHINQKDLLKWTLTNLAKDNPYKPDQTE